MPGLALGLVSAPAAPLSLAVSRSPVGDTSSPTELVVVDRFGNRVTGGLLRGAAIQRASWARNDIGGADISFPADPLPGFECDAAKTYSELQVWRHGRLIWWGVLVRKEMDAQRVVHVQAATLGWYFKHRFVGRANRVNYVTDPSFEANPGDPDYGAWVAVNIDDAHRDSSQYKLRGQSVRLYNAHAQKNAYYAQTISGFTGTGVGSLLTASAYVKVDPTSTFDGGAIGNLSLVLSRYTPGGTAPLQSGFSQTPLDGLTPRGSWQRVEATVWVPPSETDDIEVRLYAPGAVVWWDAVEVVQMESLSSVTSATDFTSDQATIMENLALHAQDPVYGKDALNIGTNCPTTGVRREKHYQFVEAANIFDALGEFSPLALYQGADWTVEHPDAHTRTFTTHFPRVGAFRPEFTLTLSLNAQVEDWVIDGEQGRNSLRVQGNDVGGADPTREEGGYINLAAFGGVAVEDVLDARPGVDIDGLNDQARGLGLKLEHPYALTVRVTDPAIVEAMFGGVDTYGRTSVRLQPGDWLAVNGRIDGEVDPQMFLWSVVDITWDVPNDELLLVLNVNAE